MGAAGINGVCATCHKIARICLACGAAEYSGAAVQGGYLEFDGVGAYCQACYQNRARCEVCFAPQTDAQWLLSDGRVMCAYCHQTAIYAPVDAMALYEEMKTVARQLLELRLNVPTGLALVDRNQLMDVIRQQEEAALSSGSNHLRANAAEAAALPLDPRLTLGLYARRGMRRGIYVQSGLPRLLFLQVAAHEYAHAWQGENCPTLAARRGVMVHEGFAEWVAYRILGHYGYRRSQERMLEREDVYGQGLKWMLQLESVQGACGVLALCQVDVTSRCAEGEN